MEALSGRNSHFLPLERRRKDSHSLAEWTAPQEITLRGLTDGKSLFVSGYKEREPVVLHVDMQGNVRLLWEVKGGAGTYAVPSPDGRHLAMQRMTVDGNLWMMESF
jgi:hypothetical protein